PFFPSFIISPPYGAPADIYERIPGPASGYYDASWASANGGAISTSIPMKDPEKAFLRGVEISWQTHFWYLPGLLSGLLLDLNASYMSSREIYPSFALSAPIGEINPFFWMLYHEISAPLQDQPRAIYNAILGWEYADFSSRISIRFQQKTASTIDMLYGVGNTYCDDVMRMDISVKQQLFSRLSLFANATNITAENGNYYLSHSAYDSFAAGQLPTYKENYSWAVQFGVAYTY
ncbi:MAG TPA: hypothetical protein VL126_04995, partial [Bacteroidota bacterium]|nr:hypothetical protein [Bacteroidota bacterium]